MSSSVPNRLIAVRKMARRLNCTHVLVTNVIDAEYISGFRSTNVTLLVSSGKAILFSDFRYREAASRFCRENSHWRFVEIAENDYSYLKEHVGAHSSIGVQSSSLTVDQYDRIRKVCRGSSFVKMGNAVSIIATVKTADEIRAHARAAGIGDRSFAQFTRQLKVGITEKDAARLLDGLCLENGSEKPSFDTIILFGARSALPHGRPSSRKLRKGDWILCDFGCTVNGLCSDMTRTVVIGSASSEQKEFYTVVQNAQSHARKQARAGMKASELDRCARGMIEAAGYGDAFGHATGHGVGREIHEAPRISSRDDTKLKENMVITIEPGIYVSGFGGVRLEDMVVLSAKGARSLTRTPRGLVELAC